MIEANLDNKVQQVSQDKQGPLVTKGFKVLTACLEMLAKQEELGLLDHLDLPELLDPLDLQVLEDSKVLLVHQDHQGRLGHLEHLEEMVNKEIQVPLA